ncbi:MAG: hypothetical protein ACXWLW_02285, partial [Rhizomicrobium sp.]
NVPSITQMTAMRSAKGLSSNGGDEATTVTISMSQTQNPRSRVDQISISSASLQEVYHDATAFGRATALV